MDETDARRVVCDAGCDMKNMGLVNGTWGNVSCRVDRDYMIITPSGMKYDTLLPENMVLVNMHDLSYEGSLKPSVETPLHSGIYESRPDINAVIHTHSINACVIGAARREVPPILDDMVQIIGGSLRVAEYSLPGSKEIAKNVLYALDKRNAAILANHGSVCLGRTMEEAFVTAQIVEKTCRVYIDAQALGGAVSLKDEDVTYMRNFFLEKYGQK